MRFAHKVTVAVIAIALAAFAAVGLCACNQQDQGAVAATFGNHKIYEDEVTAYTDQFRTQNGLTDDVQWASYLTSSSLSGSTWREEVIRKLADKLLIQDKASELGITADEDAVNTQIANVKAAQGISDDDEQAWSDYLAQSGSTPEEFKENCEYSSIEEQVFKQELDFSTDVENEMCDDYISTNFADQVVRHYSAIPFESKADAEACLEELQGLSGDALASRFTELASKESGDSSAGDLGWDFAYDETSIDPSLDLRNAKLAAGELYGKVLKGSNCYRVVMCTERWDFTQGSYADITSDSLKAAIEKLTLSSSWYAQCLEYLSNLEQQANIQVNIMPDNLSYDIVEDESSSTSSQSN